MDLRPEGASGRMAAAASAAKPSRADARRPAIEGHEGFTFVYAQTWKLSPQPQRPFSFGLVKVKPADMAFTS